MHQNTRCGCLRTNFCTFLPAVFVHVCVQSPLQGLQSSDLLLVTAVMVTAHPVSTVNAAFQKTAIKLQASRRLEMSSCARCLCFLINRHDRVLHYWRFLFSTSAARLSQRFLFCVTVCIIYYPRPPLLKWTARLCPSPEDGCSAAEVPAAVTSDCTGKKECFQFALGVVCFISTLLCSAAIGCLLKWACKKPN